MTRQPHLRPVDLSSEQAELYTSILAGPRSAGPQLFALRDSEGALMGPFGGFLLAPQIGDRLQALGAGIRYSTSLTDRCREMAILIVAVHCKSDFEWRSHESVGRACGLTESELLALRETEELLLVDPAEQACVDLTRALVCGDVDDPTWDRVVEVLGLQAAYELIVLVGYYSALALQMRVLRVD